MFYAFVFCAISDAKLLPTFAELLRLDYELLFYAYPNESV